jgi:hypothetical protein
VLTLQAMVSAARMSMRRFILPPHATKLNTPPPAFCAA